MTKLRKAVLAIAVAAAPTGCSHLQDIPPSHWSIFHCSECDDFPTPAYGPNFTTERGTYTGPDASGPSLSEEMPTSSGVANPTPPGLDPNAPAPAAAPINRTP